MDNVHWVYINKDIMRETKNGTYSFFADRHGMIPALEQSLQSKTYIQ